jgi:hypothetical protein
VFRTASVVRAAVFVAATSGVGRFGGCGSETTVPAPAPGAPGADVPVAKGEVGQTNGTLSRNRDQENRAQCVRIVFGSLG